MDLREFLLTQVMYDADTGQGAGGSGDDLDNKDDKSGDVDKGDKDTGDDPGKKDDKPKTFTQEQLDAIVADRVARANKKKEEAVKAAEAEAERKRLEEQGEYKELAEKRQEEIDRLQKLIDEQAEASKQAKKESMLSKAGYKDEQVELFVGLLTGDTDEELEASLERLKAATPPAKTYADPSAGNGAKGTPDKKGGDDVGKTMFQRLKKKGKIK